MLDETLPMSSGHCSFAVKGMLGIRIYLINKLLKVVSQRFKITPNLYIYFCGTEFLLYLTAVPS